MRKLHVLGVMGVICSVALLGAGCCGVGGGATTMRIGGTMPGQIVADNVYPAQKGVDFVQMRVQPQDIEILGNVKASSSSERTLGIISKGDNGYGALMKEARAKYPDVEGLMNIQWDTKYNAICMGALTEKIDSEIEATAFKWKRIK